MTRWFTKAPMGQQAIGLDPLWELAKGKTILDVGSAEGLIAERCERLGALCVDCFDSRPQAVAECTRRGLCAWVADADTMQPIDRYSIVLMLGILHKLAYPTEALQRFLGASYKYAVIRLPHGQWPIMTDSRSGGIPIDLGSVADQDGFEVYQVTDGPGDPAQWVGYLRRRE